MKEDGMMGSAGGRKSDAGRLREGKVKDYGDIIELERPKMKHARQPAEARAAQFAPFAALVGFARKVREAGEEHLREVETEVEIDTDIDVGADVEVGEIGEKF